MLERIVVLACRRPWAVLALALLVTTGALAFAATHFAMTTDTGALIAPNVPYRQAERRFDAAFPGQGDTILAVIDGATPELAEGAAARLAARLADDHHFARVTRPDGGDYLAREGLLLGSTADVAAATAGMIAVQPFLGPLAADPSLRGVATTIGMLAEGVARGETTLARVDAPLAALADALARRRTGRPAWFSWQALIGGEGTHAAPRRRLVLVTPLLDYGALMPGAAATDTVRATIVALNLDPAHGVRVRLTGSVPLSDEEFASLADRAWLVGGTMLAAMLVTLWLATRSWRVVAAILMTTVTGLVITSALGLAAVGRFNLISVAFIPLFVGLGVDFGIQLGVRFQAERHDGLAPDAAMAAARALGPSLLLAAAAVCLGFFAFLPTSYVGVAELGAIAGIGMLVALAFSLTLLPALLMLLRPGQPLAAKTSPLLARLDALLAHRRRAVLWTFAIAMAASIALLPWARFDFDPLHLRAPDGEAMATLTDLARDPDRNPNLIEIVAPDINAAERLAARLQRLPEVRWAATAHSFVPDDQPAKLAIVGNAQALLDLTLDPLAPASPADDATTIAALRTTAAALRGVAGPVSGVPAAHARALADELTRLAFAPRPARAGAQTMLVDPLAVMLGQMRAALSAEPVSLATLPADLRRDWIAPDGSARIEVAPRAGTTDNAAIRRFVAAVQRVAPEATGPAVSIVAAGGTIARAFILAGAIGFAVVSLLLLAVLRDVKEVAFTLAPVVLSIFLTLGTCVVIAQPINFANIIAFPLLFGVGVAFHIYFVMAWRGGATDLLQSSLARAVFFSALATGGAFGSLWLSHHPGTASMGKILMISLAWTLICALIFEPALLGPPRRKA